MFQLRHFILCCILLAGCGRVPKHELAPIASIPELSPSVQQSFASCVAREGQWVKEEWWELFNDPQLTSLIARARKESPTLKRSLISVVEAYEQAKVERAKLWFHLDFDFTEQYEYLSANGLYRSFFPIPPPLIIPSTLDLLDLDLNFSYEVDFWGKNRNLYESALGQAKAEAAQYKQVELTLTTMIAQTYFALQMQHAQRKFLEMRIEGRKTIFELSSARKEAGLDGERPLLSSFENLEMMEKTLILLEEAIAINDHLLKELIGMGPDDPLLQQPLCTSFQGPFSLPKTISSDLLAHRPDLATQIWYVESAAKQIGAAKADFYPNISLGIFVGTESLEYKKLLRYSSRTYGLLPSIHLPIFTGGRLRANLREKVAAFDQAVYAYNELVFKAAEEVSNQLVRLESSTRSLEKQREITRVTQTIYELERARFFAGLAQQSSVLNDQDAFLAQQMLLANAQNEYSLAVLGLIKSLGGGYATDDLPKDPYEY